MAYFRRLANEFKLDTDGVMRDYWTLNEDLSLTLSNSTLSRNSSTLSTYI